MTEHMTNSCENETIAEKVQACLEISFFFIERIYKVMQLA